MKANETYFISLANSRGSLTNLPFMAILTAILLGVATIPLSSMVYFGEHRTGLMPLLNAHLVAIGVSILIAILGMFQRWVFRHQVISSSLTSLLAVVGWVYALSFMALSMASVVEDPAWVFKGGVMVSGELLKILAAFGIPYIVGATVVHVLLLRKRLREGHSAKRTMGNYMAASSVYRSKSLWIIFAAAVIGPNLLSGGRYVALTVGSLMFLLFASVVTSLPVEFGYLTYLKSKDKKYWEKRPAKIVVKRAEKVANWKKMGKWTLIVLVSIVVIAVLNEVLPRIL